jgi:glycosyltransferase involved in cell wall biosynthesis
VRTVHAVVPDGLDDPTRPSGGNIYNRRLFDGLTATGWDVRVHPVGGAWPLPDHLALEELISVILAIPDDAVLLIDGLIASVVPAVLSTHANRVRIVALVHMPLGDHPSEYARSAEAAMLWSASAVVTTSEWTRQRVIELYRLEPEQIFVARPGVDSAELAPGSRGGGSLLCVGAIGAHKGHDVLVDALASMADLDWHCTCVGAFDPEYVQTLTRESVSQRVAFVGAQTGAELNRSYAVADLLLVASRHESYGMVITEALARGIPVIASAVGGIPEAMAFLPDGRRPGILVPADDPAALGGALRRWLTDEHLRHSLRSAAREARPTLSGWAATTAAVARALASVQKPTVNQEPRESVVLTDSLEGGRPL